MLIIKIALLALVLYTASPIAFSYRLPIYQMQCFHQSVEKNSRYQITVKGDSSAFYLHVVEKKVMHQDTRTINAQEKYFSAFAQQSGVLTFCIGNLAEQSIFFSIEFHHGIFLENGFQQNVGGRQLQDLSDRWGQMLKMVESNYHTYRNQLLSRQASSQRITLTLTLMIAVIVLGAVLIKVVYYRKIVGYLKEKKIV